MYRKPPHRCYHQPHHQNEDVHGDDDEDEDDDYDEDENDDDEDVHGDDDDDDDGQELAQVLQKWTAAA